MPEDHQDQTDYGETPEGEREAAFFGNRDFAFMQGVTKEFINDIVRTTIAYFKPLPGDTETDIYGESPNGKQYYRPMEMNALLVPDDQQTTAEDFGFDTDQSIQIGFQREELKKNQFYPEEGDVFEWSNYYFEVGSTVDNTLLATRFYFRHGVVVNAHRTRLSREQVADQDFN
jgi:hypothetical protein